MPQPTERARFVIAFAAGVASVAAAYVVGMPGNGLFAVMAWLGGFAALVAAPGIAGWAAVLLGIAVAALGANLAVTGTLTDGLVILVIAILAAIASHGALVAALILRGRRLGARSTTTDPAAAVGWIVAVGLLVLAWLVAGELAANPP